MIQESALLLLAMLASGAHPADLASPAGGAKAATLTGTGDSRGFRPGGRQKLAVQVTCSPMQVRLNGVFLPATRVEVADSITQVEFRAREPNAPSLTRSP